MAEGVGFEPTVGLPLLLISSQVPLTTQPPFLNGLIYFSRIRVGGKLIRCTVKCVQGSRHASRLLLLAGFEGAFDPLPGLDGQCLFRLLVVFTVLRGGPQKFDLLPVTQAPDAKREVNPQSDSLKPRQRAIERVGLQADGLPAIGRKRADDFGEPVHD
jgi:hypothetical protein